MNIDVCESFGNMKQRAPRVVSSRGASPPPHIIGKIVEMGFSIEQAKVALASTDSGLDVEAALETLLSQAPEGDGTYNELDDESRQHTDDSEDVAPQTQQRRRPKARHSPEHSAPLQSSDDLDRPGLRRAPPSSSSGINTDQLQQHADRLLTQASDFGMSMWKNANVFWKEGKERVVKAYEEQTKGTRSPNTSASKGGKQSGSNRPKWM